MIIFNTVFVITSFMLIILLFTFAFMAMVLRYIIGKFLNYIRGL